MRMEKWVCRCGGAFGQFFFCSLSFRRKRESADSHLCLCLSSPFLLHLDSLRWRNRCRYENKKKKGAMSHGWLGEVASAGTYSTDTVRIMDRMGRCLEINKLFRRRRHPCLWARMQLKHRGGGKRCRSRQGPRPRRTAPLIEVSAFADHQYSCLIAFFFVGGKTNKVFSNQVLTPVR